MNCEQAREALDPQINEEWDGGERVNQAGRYEPDPDSDLPEVLPEGTEGHGR